MGHDQLILEAVDLHRVFETAETSLHVLRGISLQVYRGEIVSMIGASGVGKSTLLHLLGGLDRPSKGAVKINGVNLVDQSEKELARFRNKHVGFVFQFHYLLEDFSALENVMIPMLVSDMKKHEAQEKAEHIIELVGLKDRAKHRPAQLSGGEQQRIAVARALANEPDLVLADEPSGNLDTRTGQQLHELLFRLNQDRATTFVIATHNRQLAEGCQRSLEIREGNILETG